MSKIKFVDFLTLKKHIETNAITSISIPVSIVLILMGGLVRGIQIINSVDAGLFPDNIEFILVSMTSLLPVFVEKVFQIVVLLGLIRVLKIKTNASFRELFNIIAVSNVPRIIVGIITAGLSFAIFGFRFDQVYNYDIHSTFQTLYSIVHSAVILVSGVWSLFLNVYYNKNVIDVSTIKAVILTFISLFGGFVMRSMIL